MVKRIKRPSKTRSAARVDVAPMPFDDALRRILSAAPKHKTKKKKVKKSIVK